MCSQTRRAGAGGRRGGVGAYYVAGRGLGSDASGSGPTVQKRWMITFVSGTNSAHARCPSIWPAHATILHGHRDQTRSAWELLDMIKDDITLLDRLKDQRAGGRTGTIYTPTWDTTSAVLVLARLVNRMETTSFVSWSSARSRTAYYKSAENGHDRTNSRAT